MRDPAVVTQKFLKQIEKSNVAQPLFKESERLRQREMEQVTQKLKIKA